MELAFRETVTPYRASGNATHNLKIDFKRLLPGKRSQRRWQRTCWNKIGQTRDEYLSFLVHCISLMANGCTIKLHWLLHTTYINWPKFTMETDMHNEKRWCWQIGLPCKLSYHLCRAHETQRRPINQITFSNSNNMNAVNRWTKLISNDNTDQN